MGNKNMFCNRDDLTNESSVEQFFVIRLLKDLGFRDNDIKTKSSIKSLVVGKGSKKETHKPDYVCYRKKLPRLVIDAKDPEITVDKYLYQTSGYALSLNQKFVDSNPIQYFVLTNGSVFKLYQWDNAKPLLSLAFQDFEIDNKKYEKLKSIISAICFEKNKKVLHNNYDFIKPSPKEINGVFKKSHNLIWKKERIGPTKAFYEFCKLMFIKLNEDNKIKDLVQKGQTVTKDDFLFSSHWIKKQEKIMSNPINSILFSNLKEELEEGIENKNKKRIFEKTEEIQLKPSTIIQAVKLLERYDLGSIDEDLNGRLFEQFLSATIRGKELGQFFTPRLVAKFMTKLADLEINFNKKTIDKVLDGCCGTGGFLIEAMTDLLDKVENNSSLSSKEKRLLIKKIKTNSIYGIDDSPMISRIARINMHLHGDGNSRIYRLDSLDKNLKIEKGINKELRNECQEFKDAVFKDDLKFDVILTNPPFSMSYKQDDPEEYEILKYYDMAIKKETNKMVSSLNSNIMFIERYYELLRPGGKLLTVIDESLLTTSSYSDFRNYIREKFIIKAVISLPENTFIKADTGVKSSILYLVKKSNKDEQQPSTFMAMCNNIGHNDSGRSVPQLNELFGTTDTYDYDFTKGILLNFLQFEKGKLDNKKYNPSIDGFPKEEDWQIYTLDKFNDRLDVKFNSPYLKNLRLCLKENSWKRLGDLIKKEESVKPEVSDFYRLIDLRNVEEKTATVGLIKEVEELNSEKILFIKGQLLISLLSPEKGKVILVDKELEGCVGSTELLPVTVSSPKVSLNYIWVIIRSKIILDQWKYQVTGSTPSRYRIDENILNETIIPVPKKNIQEDYSTKIIKEVDENRRTNAIFKDSIKHIEETSISEILKKV